MFKASIFFAATALIALSAQRAASDASSPIAPSASFSVPKDFRSGDEKLDVSHDLSGIACRPESGVPRLCVVIDDQGSFAQTAVLEDQKLTAGEAVDLISEEKEDEIRGVAPEGHCKKNDGKFRDLDGEGVAYDGDYFYVVGSHGCSRGKDRFSRSSFITARFRLDASGERVDPVETTYRLSDALEAAPAVSAFFGKSLNSEDGLNIEGVAVIGGVLYAGARAPSANGMAFIIAARADALFAPGSSNVPLDVRQFSLDLGDDVGIRDLAPLSDGRLLVLAGPTQGQDTLFSLYAVTLPAVSGPAVWKFIAALEARPLANDGYGEWKRPKAEAVLPLEPSAKGELRVLVLFDGPENGSPLEYSAPLPPQ